MSLPKIPLPTATFTFKSGATLEIRGLSRQEALDIRQHGQDARALEIHCIQVVTDATAAEVEAWIKETPQDEVERLVNEIADLSGMNEGKGKADAEASLSATLTELTTLLRNLSENPSEK